jgi:hypothetical protein
MLAQPSWRHGPRMQVKPFRSVPRSKHLHGVAAYLVRRRNVGEDPPIRSAEAKLFIRLSIDPVALLVDGAVVMVTEQGEVRECGGPSVGPVTDVMPLAQPRTTARETTALVAMVERPP